MPELEVVCPSGLAGTVRGWKTKEAELLANRKNARSGAGFDKMLKACWTGTAEPGPYAVNGTIDWGKVLTCDRFWALLMIRAATFGDSYEFDVPCQERGLLCGKRIDWECNLSELPCKPLDEAVRDQIANGENRFEHALEYGEHAGKVVFFNLQTGTGEKRAAKLMGESAARPIVASLASRIIEVEGVEKGGLVRFLDDMEMADLNNILTAFEQVDGGVETIIEIECQNCGLLQDVELPLERDFWLPRRKKRSKKARLLDSL